MLLPRISARWVALSLATILVGAGASAAAAQAANTLVLSPQTGPAGTLVNASGVFADHCGVRLSWDAIGGTVLGEPPVGRDGTYVASVLVPTNAGAGSHLVVAVGLVLGRDLTCSLETSDVARQTFVVVASGGGLSASLALSSAQPRPGQGVLLDAGASVGEIDSFEFDLDGNGTYETSCGGPKAVVVHNERGARSIGLRIGTVDGRTATARATLTIAGATAPPPGGGPTLPMRSGTIVGSCVDQQVDLVDATAKAWTCPQTVFVGVVEATFRKSGINAAKQDACFERHEGKHAGIDVAFFVASKNSSNAVGNPVLVNGLEFDHPVETTYPKPFYKNELMLMETIPLLGAFGPYGPSSPKTSDFRITLQSPGHMTSVASEPFSLAEPWDISTSSVAHWVSMGKKTYLANNEILGLSVAKKLTPVKFAPGYSSRLTLHATLPFTNFQLVSSATSAIDVVAINNGGSSVVSPASKAGPSWGRRTVEATTQISFTGIKLGMFTMNASLVYTQDGTSDVWSGDMTLIFPQGVTVKGTLVIRDGEFELAHFVKELGPTGLGPIGCCVWIYQLFGDLTPLFVGAGAIFGIGPKVPVIDAHPVQVTGQAQIFYGDPWAFVLSASDLKVVGINVDANAKVMISSSGFFGDAFIDEDWGPLELQANLAAKVTGSTWFAGGAASVCVDLEVVEGCGGGAAGIGKKGVAGCAVIPYLPDGGVALQWEFFKGDLLAWDLYWGCSFGKVASHVGANALNRSRARAVDGLARAGVRVERGLPKVLFAVEGAGAPPKITLSSPDGAKIASDPGEPVASGPGWTLVELPHDNTTYVTVEEPASGSWEISEQAGSSITSIGVGSGLPKRLTEGHLGGSRRARTLRYQIADVDGVRVTFVESAGDPTSGDPGSFVEQVIGTARGGTGSIRFAPAESSIRHRSIEAVISVGGIPVATEKIGSYTAPPLAPLPAPDVDVRRSRRSVTIGWTRVPGASFYRVEVDRSDGATDVFDVSGLAVRVRGITPRTTTRIVVRAVSVAGYFGKIGRATSPSAIGRTI